MISKSYRLKADRFDVPAGTICFEARGHDYGCSSDDTRFSGIQHISVTLDPEGGYPFFTVPVRDLEPHVAQTEIIASTMEAANREMDSSVSVDRYHVVPGTVPGTDDGYHVIDRHSGKTVGEFRNNQPAVREAEERNKAWQTRQDIGSGSLDEFSVKRRDDRHWDVWIGDQQAFLIRGDDGAFLVHDQREPDVADWPPARTFPSDKAAMAWIVETLLGNGEEPSNPLAP